MSEETIAAEAAPPDQGAVADPVAITLALGGASQERADAFLIKQEAFIEDQRRLTALQIEKLATQEHFEQSHLHWRRFNDRMKGALQIMTVLMGLAVVMALGVTMWNASRAEGLVVETFSVSPTLAEAGVTGDAISEEVTNQIGAIRNSTEGRTFVTNGSIRQDRGEDIKVEIPETGISLTQVWRYLKSWLGNERHLRGSLRGDDDGRIRLTVALDGASASFSGASGDLDKIEQQAAEHVYSIVEATNYLLYLRGAGRGDEALAAAAKLAEAARTPEERAYRYGMWAEFTQWVSGDFALAMARIQLSIAADPKANIGHLSALRIASLFSRQEDALLRTNEVLSLTDQKSSSGSSTFGNARLLRYVQSERDLLQGDYAAFAEDRCGSDCVYSTSLISRARAAAHMHDPTGSRALIAQALAAEFNPDANLVLVRVLADMAAQDWKAAVRDAGAYKVAVDAGGTAGYRAALKLINGQVWLAEATARSGDNAGGEELIAATPMDCDACVLVRGRIAALKQDRASATRWFQLVSARSPHIPFADTEWGQSLLASGKPDAAIEKFTIANQKGPKFADPLEGWGEALMAKNQSHLALAKFAEAEKYAPNWRRLHLKWGEALVYAGKKGEAKAQFARAAALDLTPSEKAELARHP